MTSWVDDEVGGTVWSDDESGAADGSLTGSEVDVDADKVRVIDATDNRPKLVTVEELVANTSVFTQSGTRPSNGTVAAGLHDLCYNVRSAPFLATADGTTDDTTAIQTAINIAEAAGGGTVFFPEGTYLVSSLTVDSDNVTLAGTGRGSIIKSTSDDEIVKGMSAAGLVVRDLQILGDADALKTLQRGIQWTSVTDGLIHNVYVKNCGYDGILLLSGCVGNTVSSCNVTGCTDDGINIGGDNSAICRNNTVVGNVVTSCTGVGVHISDGSSFTSVVGNTIHSCGTAGIDTFQSGAFIGTGNNTITGNTIRNCTTYGIHIKDSDNNIVSGNNVDGGGRSLRVENSERSEFVGNVLSNPTTGGFLDDTNCADLVLADNIFVGSLGTVRINGPRAQVRGNSIKGVGQAIIFEDTADNSICNGNLISGGTNHNIQVEAARCVISGNRLAAGDRSIDIVSGAIECVITGNVITEGARGIQVGATDCLVSGNILNGQTTFGIYAASTSRTQIVGNHIRSAARAINLFGSTDAYIANNVTVSSTNESIVEDGTSSGTTLLDNKFDKTVTMGGATPGMRRGNQGFVTEASGTGAIASGATTATVTHGLAVTPTVDDISITFGEQGTNDYGRFWIDNITSTQFQVNVSADPGASNLDFGWRAVVL
jgi:parallel beta-helix repeat protein